MENDDTHVGAVHHPGVTTIPAALAVAEREGLGGKALVAGIVAGYEVMIRLGVAMQPSLFGDRGFHSTAVMGHFGAAAASASLLGLTTEQTMHALGLAASYASGLGNWYKGGMVKYIHAGKAARGGVEAALLADAGITVPPQVFEGKRGFCHGYADEYDLETVTRGLGEEWVTLEVHLKPHATSRHTQAAIQATASIAAEQSFLPSDVDYVEVLTNPEMSEVMTRVEPLDVIEVQSSIPMVVATTLFKGGSRTLDEYLLFEDIQRAMHDPEIKALARRVRLPGDPAFDLQTGDAQVTIGLATGESYTRYVDIIKGSPDDPFTMSDLRQRFFDQASAVLPENRLATAADRIEALQEVDRIEEITGLLGG
jgi:2-methylcitrate dehydratase PrpD